MNFFSRFLCLGCLPKRKPRRPRQNRSDLQVHPRKMGPVVHPEQENRGIHAHFVCRDVRHSVDLETLTAQIQHDLEETAPKIQIDLERMEPFIHGDCKIPVCEVQRDLEEISTKIQRDLEDLVAQRQHSPTGKAGPIRPQLDGKDELIQRDLDQLATWTRRDLDRTVARIQSQLDEAAAWIQRDLNETVAWIRRDIKEKAAWIRLDLERLESHIQHDLKVPVDNIQCGLEETSIQVQSDLQDLVAQWQFSLEEKTEQIKPKVEEEDKQVQRKLRTATWIETKVETATFHILHDLTGSEDQFECEMDDILIQIQRDQDFSLEEMTELNNYDLDENAADYEEEWDETLLENNGMSLENFVLHKVLGRGSFGKVMLAELKGSGEYFAIKALKKENILANNHIQFLMTERHVLRLTTECPFLAHLHFTFQTKANLFFVMEYINGGELFFHIQERGHFDLVSTQFYAAEMTCGLQFLHRNGIIYRDLKLENVMLDRDGHIKIVDFGLCKGNMFGDERTNSFCGTDHYMAPELFLNQPYFSPADWWSFGVLLFEMLTGGSPFEGADKVELRMSVCMDIPQYPTWINRESKDILEKLLEKDPNDRLGTFGNIREHAFFESIDWPRLERREAEPPFKPELVNRNDCKYFDEVFLNQAPEMSQGNCSYSDPMDQYAFADFSFINPMFYSTY